ncbi:MAG: alpha/beta fold hydrolase [Alphaproteobacteria bacterium]
MTIDGCRIALRRGGKGEAMLYLHGANGAGTWAPFMAQLADKFDLIVPEHPGFGGSDMPDWLDTVGDLAYFYLDLIKALGLRRVHLVGASLGGWIAAELAVRSGHDLASLTAIAPAGLQLPGVPMGDPFLWSPEEAIRNLIFDQAQAERMLAVAPSAADEDAQMKNRFATARLAWQPRMFNPHLAKWLHRIAVPAHIVWGREDRLIPVAYAAAWGERVPGTRVTIVPECGHLPHVEKPAALVAAVAGFCAGASR